MLAPSRIRLLLLAACYMLAAAKFTAARAPEDQPHTASADSQPDNRAESAPRVAASPEFFDPHLAAGSVETELFPHELHDCESDCPSVPLFATVEAVALRRRDNNQTQPLVIDANNGSTLISTGDLNLDYEPGLRATIGVCRPSCCESFGWEFTYLGVLDWDAAASVSGTNSLSAPGDIGFVVNGFTLSESIRVESVSRLHSAEVNCIECVCDYCCDDCSRQVDWFAGFRYLSLNESLTLFGDNQTVAAASYDIDTDNDLYGAQLGARMRTYRGCWGWEALGKAGVFVNDASQRQVIVDELGVNDFVVRDASANGQNTAFVGELGISILRQFSDTCQLRCGYNLLWIESIALASGQLDFSDTASSGTLLRNGGGTFLHGASLGFTVDW